MEIVDRGSVTQALQEGGDANREYIIQRVWEIYGELWRALACRSMPSDKRRAGNEDDAVQETLMELDRILRKNEHQFKSRVDLRKLGARILSCNAKDQLRLNRRLIGKSQIVADEEPVESPAEVSEVDPSPVWDYRVLAPEQASAEVSEVDPSSVCDYRVLAPEQASFEQDLLGCLETLNQSAQALLDKLLLPDRDIISQSGQSHLTDLS